VQLAIAEVRLALNAARAGDDFHIAIGDFPLRGAITAAPAGQVYAIKEHHSVGRRLVIRRARRDDAWARACLVVDAIR